MGCDGGTIPTRDELVKTKKRPEQKDKDAERVYQWQHCHLTQEPLRPPIVACQMGKLYNKEAVILKLLDKQEAGNALGSHIKSLKDVKELKLTPNPNLEGKKAASRGDSYEDKLASAWICPVTGLEMNGRFKFILDWSSGRVMSLRGHQMIKKDESSIREEDVVVLNPEEGEESQKMSERMQSRNREAKAAKKEKKRKKDEGEPSSKKLKESKDDKGAEKSATPSNNGKKEGSKSVQKDNSKSEVYKSIFSSHPTAQNRPKGHWVTFDPRYN